MVFISLEDVVGPSNSSTGTSQSARSRPTKATTSVVVTPGSLTKQDTHTSRAGLFQMSSTQWASSTPQNFVLYVSDSVMRQKWVIGKTSSDHAQLRKGVYKAANGCNKSACCRPLRRLLKTFPNVSTRRMWGSNSAKAQYNQCSVFQEYMNALVQTVLGCDSQCESRQRTRHLVEDFLDIPSQRAAAVDRVIHHVNVAPSSTSPENPCHQVGQDGSNATDDSSECTICSGDLADDQTLRLPCGHSYHSECVHVWLNLQRTCPVCRLQIDMTVISP
ncbi:hypothetical protein PHYBOEH_007200 [Phytophthora boehmeriae]|uniref:RING-type domain-containing protein n=1 Tax=Phytophthora boehmeriae TaxID=109152 RepID=A0A8T1W988_9STRA|nr:hypothetical protein PHYBOEH_007200 [Phytophthora boehmeriae]